MPESCLTNRIVSSFWGSRRESYMYMITFGYVACLDFEIIEIYSNFVVTDRQTHTHTHTHTQSTAPSAHAGEGNTHSGPKARI